MSQFSYAGEVHDLGAFVEFLGRGPQNFLQRSSAHHSSCCEECAAVMTNGDRWARFFPNINLLSKL